MSEIIRNIIITGMNEFDITQKIIIAAFIIVTLIVLWAISPMGKMYFPMDVSKLQEEFGFKVPDDCTLKAVAKLEGKNTYHLYNERYSPTVFTLIGFNEPVKREDLTNIPSNKTLLKFWENTYLKDPKFSNCGDKLIKRNKTVFMCNFEADKAEMNNSNPKEGEIALIEKDGKYIFLSATASKMAYSPILTRKLLIAILKNNE